MPFAICWDGSKGACNAEMAEDAVGPDVAEFTVCGRAVEMPVAGSAFPAGHIPLVGFFRAAQLPASVVAFAAPLACTVAVEAVEFCEDAELLELMEEEEFCRGRVFRCPGTNILRTSSSLIPPNPAPLGAHRCC